MLKTNNKGITLIALVITIIVLIILAGVAISMLSGDNGILNQAASAKQQTEEQSELEQVKLAATASMINENHKVDKEQLDKELANYGLPAAGGDETSGYTLAGNQNNYIIANDGTVTVEGGEGEDIPVVTEPPTTAVAEKTKFQDTTSDNKIAVIPEGFRVSGEADEQKIDTGLVVIAPDESEFVWVPVEDETTMYGMDEYGGRLGKIYENGDINSPLDWTESDGIMKCKSFSDHLEPFTVEFSNDTSAEYYYKDILGYDSLSDYSREMNDIFNNMTDSVKIYQGFYVGRYETSLEDGKAQSIKGKKSATAATDSANTWYGLYKIEMEYSKNNNLINEVGSSMIWGSQYDQMMIWMKNKNIDVTSKTPVSGASRNTTRITGDVETDKLNNVYDLLGNSMEFTLEAYYWADRVTRRWTL